MKKDDKFYKEYFGGDGDCFEHYDYACNDCYKEVLKDRAQDTSSSMVLMASNSDHSFLDNPREEIEKFEKTINFIKTALDMSDVGIDRLKVADIGKKFEQAKAEITVGKMKKLLGEKKAPKKTGVVKSVARFMVGLNKKK